VKTLLFVPYASVKPNSYDEYTEKVRKALDPDFQVEGLHQYQNREVRAIESAQAIFIGGGNTFLLLKTLYEKHLVEVIRERVLEHALPYIGSSAGTNVATTSIHTTNDMPICYPPTFYALQLVNFNINPHYLDPEPDSKHKGETRQDRIQEFHHLNDRYVLGLREGACLLIDGPKATLLGLNGARLFQRDQEPQEFQTDSDLSFLLE
jgi:dipeptidase E